MSHVLCRLLQATRDKRLVTVRVFRKAALRRRVGLYLANKDGTAGKPLVPYGMGVFLY